MKKFKKRILSAVMTLAMAVTTLLGGVTTVSADTTLINEETSYTGNATYIATYMRDSSFTGASFQITYKYNSLDSNGYYTEDDGTTKTIDYSDTFEFLAFDTNWGGWNKTCVGQSSPSLGVEYTETVSVDTIAATLSEGSTLYGINLQTGGIGNASVSIVSLKLVTGTTTTKGFTATGSWTKGSTDSTFTIDDSTAAMIAPNEYNIEVSSMTLTGFTNPTVEVTVTYSGATSDYVQAEILVDGSPMTSNYVMISAESTVTYKTSIPNTTTSFLACYDGGTVTQIKVYDDSDGNVSTTVTGLDAEEIAQNMGLAWNLGNQFEASDSEGNPSETAWGNPVVDRDLIVAVKNAGFNTIRIPVSYLNAISTDGDGNYTIDSTYLRRLKIVVDYAYNLGMYVVIDIHNDGASGVTGSWIDITKSGTDFEAVNTKFAAVWTIIANYFADYDQRLIFEGFNELMNGSYSSGPSDEELANVNTLNQTFVSAVRATGGNNEDRVLIVAGYNTNIDYTVSDFEKPKDSAEDRLMLSVHYYDPYDFALNESGTDAWDASYAEDMESSINDIADYASSYNMPVFIGEYAAIDKSNTSARGSYCYYLNYYASSCTAATIVTGYWDNGSISTYGTGLFERTSSSISATTTGQTIINQIVSGYQAGKTSISE